MSADLRPSRARRPHRRGGLAVPFALPLVVPLVGLALALLAPLLPGTRWTPLPLPEPGAETVGAPAGPAYVVIDRANNRLSVRRGEAVLLDAVVSTGSGAVLREPGGRSWVFDTPTGRFRVAGERRKPVWVKPDWAFIEEGTEVPSDPRARREAGALGEYALDLVDGYMIHGTLYETLLGRSVTHGCVRVGRDDLRRLVDLVGRGTEVLIY